MPTVEALKCASCGAPLPIDGTSFAECEYCGTISRIGPETTAKHLPVTPETVMPIVLPLAEPARLSFKRQLWRAFVNYARDFNESTQPLAADLAILREQLAPDLPR